MPINVLVNVLLHRGALTDHTNCSVRVHNSVWNICGLIHWLRQGRGSYSLLGSHLPHIPKFSDPLGAEDGGSSGCGNSEGPLRDPGALQPQQLPQRLGSLPLAHGVQGRRRSWNSSVTTIIQSEKRGLVSWQGF